MRLFIVFLFFAGLVLGALAGPLAAQDREIPIIIDDGDAEDPAREVEVVSNEEKPKTGASELPASRPESAPAAKPPVRGLARVVRGGAPLQPLVRTFRKYRADADFDPRIVADDATADAERAEKLRKDLLKWKQMRIEAKGLKAKNDPGFEKLYARIRDFEEEIIREYAPVENAAVETVADAVPAEEETPGSGVEDIAARTETGRLLLEKLKTRGKDGAEDAGGEELGVEQRSADVRLDELRHEREPRGFRPANVRWTPRRVTFNQVPPGAASRNSFTIENKGNHPFQGAIVPIEEWIQVNPPTVYLEPRASIVVDVIATAPDRKKVRVEGSIEIRSPGESSRRVPVVLRTLRR